MSDYNEAAKIVRTEELLNLLLCHMPLRQCAQKLGISYATAQKYAKEPEFLVKLKELSGTIYEEVLVDLKTDARGISEKIKQASDDALTVLVELMHDTRIKSDTRLKAADSILDRNSESARNRKVQEDVNARHTLDPILLMHAAATAQEVEQARQKRLGSGEGQDEQPR